MTEEILLRIENEEIIFAESTNREILEFIVICKSGNIYLFDFLNRKNKLIGTLEFPVTYSEDYFKSIEFFGYKKEFLQIYSYKNYICITQKYGQDGVVLNLENPEYKKKLKRGDYCVEHCIFPIAFYSEENFTFLIHGTDWNRLDITNLENGELLTDRIVDYETASNYSDYFHSSLLTSPDENHFTSNGWIWHPFGLVTLYSIDDFLKNFELSHEDIDITDDPYNSDWDKPLCWLDEKTLAIGFSKNVENDGKTNFPDEILFIDIPENKIVNRIEFDGFGNTIEGEVFGELFYEKEHSQFICLNNKKGLHIADIEGKNIYKDQNFTSHKYSSKHKLFYRSNFNNQTIEIVKI